MADRPPQSLDVPVAPVGGRSPRGGGRRPLIAMLAVGGVLLAAVALAQLFPALPARTVVVPPPAESPSPSPDLEAPVIASARRVRASELAAGIADATLDGALVYADAKLIGRCRSTATTACTIDLSVDGLAVDVVQAASIDGEPAPAPPGSLLVLAVRGRRLDYLGSLIVDPDGPPSLDALSSEAAAAPDPFARQLHDVGGWLVTDPRCPPGANGGAGCDREPFLADEQPLPDGTLRSDAGGKVLLSPTVWGVDRDLAAVSPGPFLVRATGRPEVPWQVVARYDPSRSVRVVIP